MEIQKHSETIFQGILGIIENTRKEVALFLNVETTCLYWKVGRYINCELASGERMEYGMQIIATLSQLLTQHYGKGFTYTVDEKEIRVAQYLTELPSKEWFADKLHRSLEIAKMNSPSS